MNRQTRLGSCIAAAVCTLTLSACSIPICEQPLSDDASSKPDERLIGTWELDMTALNARMGAPEEAQKTMRYTVESLKETPGRMIGIGGEGESQQRVTLYATHLAMHDYLSYGPLNRDAKTNWAIMFYQMQDADQGNLYLMDGPYVRGAIERRELPGRVESEGGSVRGILITATNEELRTFLKRHSPRCFDLKAPIACKRVK
jgi:hypothetical protein